MAIQQRLSVARMKEQFVANDASAYEINRANINSFDRFMKILFRFASRLLMQQFARLISALDINAFTIFTTCKAILRFQLLENPLAV
jgi:hypothetical protein